MSALELFHGEDLRGKDGPLSKASHKLVELHEQAASNQDKNLEVEGEGAVVSIKDGEVAVDAVASGDGHKLRADLERLGLNQSARAENLVSGWLPIDAIDKAAKLQSLESIRPAVARAGAGEVSTKGDTAMQSDVARLDKDVDGTGVEVGVISDSYNQKYDFGTEDDAEEDIQSGDLPPSSKLQIIDDSSIDNPKDEGRAMMQIVHDVAPGSPLAFHSGFPGRANMVDAIRDLADAGSDVIVDDLTFFGSPYFQDGPIAQVADSVAKEGIPYFSSAGNHAQQSYANQFRSADVSGRTFHDFDSSSGTVDIYQNVYIPVGESIDIVFQWTDPYGSPDSDLDVFLVNDTTGIEESSEDPNTSFPLESITYENDGSVDANGDGKADVVFSLAFEVFSGPTPDRIKYISLNDNDGIEYTTASPTVIAHHNAANVASVGAVRYSETPEYGTDPPRVRSFSSEGGTPIYFDDQGNSLSTPIVRNKPDFVAPDGADNTFFGSDTNGDGYPNFPGTSAAAPHAAGLGALMLELDSQLTPSEIYSSLEESAIDMDDPATSGFDSGFDFRTGHGLIQADQASPLPVELARFTGTRSGEDIVRLSWKTASEEDNSGFNVQRRVPGQDSWEKVAFINSKAEGGTTAEPKSYSYTDKGIPYEADSIEYRLRQVDLDGSMSLTEKVRVGRPTNSLELLGTAPNPVRRQATVRFAVPSQTEATLKVYDILGREVHALNRNVSQGRHEVRADMSDLSSGVYFLRLKTETESVTRKLTVVQ